MLNMIKMDLYRMFRSKSLYVIWIILLGAIIFSAFMTKMQYDTVLEQMENSQEAEVFDVTLGSEESEEKINIGMSVMVPTEPGEKVAIFDEFYANVQSKFVAIFIAIFAVIFSTADINSGYIKNIGGQVKNRGSLIISKALCLISYTIISMGLVLATQTVVSGCLYGELNWGNKGDFALYVLVQTALHIALVLICMAIAILLRNNVISMAVVVCLCMNLMMLIYMGIGTLIQKMGFEDVQLMEYTVSGRIGMLSNAPDSQECVMSFIIAAVFGVVVTALTSMVFKHRDI